MKSEWWEYYDLKDSTDEELLEKCAGLAGLEPVGRVAWEGKLPVYRYRFEKQETAVRAGDKVCRAELTIGEVVEIDLARRTVDIRKTRKAAEVHPAAVFVDPRGPGGDVMAQSLFRLGIWVKDNGLDAPGPYRAARNLLLRRSPRLVGGEELASGAQRAVLALEESVLPIQGPPGSGKTYTGARMICALARQGKRVGVVATSHKVIRLLLKGVAEAAAECGLRDLAVVEKVGGKDDEEPQIRDTTDNAQALSALHGAGPVVVGGTSWMWSREEFRDSVDVLFVDEAGQMSLANVLAVAQACKSMVPSGRPAATGATAQGQPSGRRGGFGAGASAGGSKDHAPGARPVSGEDMAAASESLRVYLGSLLRGPAGVHSRGWSGSGSKGIPGSEMRDCGSCR